MTNEEMRILTGNKESSDRLVQFLYILLRDGLPAGKVEEMVEKMPITNKSVMFTNGYIADYATLLAKRIQNEPNQ